MLGASALLVTNPIPEQYAMDKTVIDKAIDQALAESHEQTSLRQIVKKSITLFRHLNEID